MFFIFPFRPFRFLRRIRRLIFLAIFLLLIGIPAAKKHYNVDTVPELVNSIAGKHQIPVQVNEKEINNFLKNNNINFDINDFQINDELKNNLADAIGQLKSHAGNIPEECQKFLNDLNNGKYSGFSDSQLNNQIENIFGNYF